METRKKFKRQDTTTELRAVIDLVDANVSPVTAADAWELEIAARRRECAAEPPAPSRAIREVIDLSTALA